MYVTLVANKPVFSMVFTGRENSFSVSHRKPCVGNIWIILPDGPKAADLVVWACTGQVAQALHSLYYLIKENIFLISVRNIQRVKQRIWSDLRKAWLKIKGRQNEVVFFFSSLLYEKGSWKE